MQPSVARGFAGLAVSLSVYVGAIVAMAVLDRWYLVAPLVVVAGLGGWGLHCIAHECGHGSFSRNRRLNFVIGHLALLHLLYPFHAWRHVHNLHHAHTNSLELDTDWATDSRGGLPPYVVAGSDRSTSACAPGRCGVGRSTTGCNPVCGLRTSRRRKCAATRAGRWCSLPSSEAHTSQR